MSWQDFKHQYLVRLWSPVPAVNAAGVLSAYYFGITGTFRAVTGESMRWGGHLLQFAGVDLSNRGYFKVIGLQAMVEHLVAEGVSVKLCRTCALARGLVVWTLAADKVITF